MTHFDKLIVNQVQQPLFWHKSLQISMERLLRMSFENNARILL